MPLRAGPVPLVVILPAQDVRRKNLHDGLGGCSRGLVKARLLRTLQFSGLQQALSGG